jgi:hypothetical protein
MRDADLNQARAIQRAGQEYVAQILHRGDVLTDECIVGLVQAVVDDEDGAAVNILVGVLSAFNSSVRLAQKAGVRFPDVCKAQRFS